MVRVKISSVVAIAVVASSHAAVAAAGSVDCKMGAWIPHACDGTTLTQVFTRTVTKDKQGSGRGCGPLTETRPCKKVNCAASAWTPWSLCDVDDYKVRTRLVELSFNGHECPVDRLKRNPTDCLISPWACPELVETAPCDPIDCVPDNNWVRSCESTTGSLFEMCGEAVAAQHGGAICQASDKKRALPDTCSSGTYYGLVSPRQYDCKPPIVVNGSITLTSSVSIDYVDFVIDYVLVVSSYYFSLDAAIAKFNNNGGSIRSCGNDGPAHTTPTRLTAPPPCVLADSIIVFSS